MAPYRQHPAPEARQPVSCLGRTCLKWSPNGELSAPDLQLIVERLRLADHQADSHALAELGEQRFS